MSKTVEKTFIKNKNNKNNAFLAYSYVNGIRFMSI